MVTKRDPKGVQRLILDAAAEAFAAHGPAGARIDAIAAAAGVNKRMLYHYFGNKEALFAAVLDDRLGVALADALPDSRPVDLVALRLMVWASVEGVAPGAEYTADWQALVARLEAGQASGELRDDVDAPLLAVTLFAVAAMSGLMPEFIGQPVTMLQVRKLITSTQASDKIPGERPRSRGERPRTRGERPLSRGERPRIRMQPDVRGR
ncbi:MAG: TetR/AcrR family transcriptional regulator [Gammaproteobacteria bacterium]|nr:TetR/AcrR family transcriptional regulator [Gammaproteobacteria bacterium]